MMGGVGSICMRGLISLGRRILEFRIPLGKGYMGDVERWDDGLRMVVLHRYLYIIINPTNCCLDPFTLVSSWLSMSYVLRSVMGESDIVQKLSLKIWEHQKHKRASSLIHHLQTKRQDTPQSFPVPSAASGP